MSEPNITPNDQGQVECSICSFVLGQARADGSVEAGVYLPCTHFFGMRCLAHSLVERQTCPVCRTAIPRDILIDLMRIGRGLSGSGTGDRPTAGGRTWRELDMEEAARDARSIGRRGGRGGDDSDEETSPRSPFSRGGGRAPPFPPPRSSGPRQRPTIIVREVDERGNVVETPESPSLYPIDANQLGSSTPSRRPQRPQYDDPYGRDGEEDPRIADFFADRARQFQQSRGRDAASSSSPRPPPSRGPPSREEQYRPQQQPYSPGRRDALPGYIPSPYDDRRRRSPPPSFRRPASPPPSSRRPGRGREDSLSSIDSGYGGDRGGGGSSGGSRHGQPTITRTPGGVEIIEVTRDLGSLSMRDRQDVSEARRGYGRERGGSGDDDGERRRLMDRALNDPDYFRRGDRYLNRRREEEFDPYRRRY